MSKSTQQRRDLWQKLAKRLTAGDPLVVSLEKVADELTDPVLRETLAEVKDHVCSGDMFSEAMERHPDHFSVAVTAMVKGGEAGGVLEVVCQNLADGFADGTFIAPGEPGERSMVRSWKLFQKLITTGVPILTALSVVAVESGETAEQDAWQSVRERVRNGESMASAMGEHTDVFPEPVINTVGKGEERSDLPAAIERIVNALGKNDLDSLNQQTAGSVDASDSSQAIVRTVSQILMDAYEKRASDIHLEPQEDGQLVVRLRVDGILRPYKTYDDRMHKQIINRLKVMAGLDIAERRLPQDGRIMLKIGNSKLDLRLCSVADIHGERITIRILARDILADLNLERIGFGERELSQVREALARGHGTIICSGPTGSGKTTTMYCMVRELDCENQAIFSVEHPVEYILPGISQFSVRPNIGLTYGALLRALLRQDPDVLMVSEIRDFETLQLATQASLTGHLVLTQLHTNTAASSLQRLIDIGLEPFLISGTVSLVVNQRLVRRLCDKCRRPVEPSLDWLPANVAEFAKTIDNATFYEPAGCDACASTSGYRGRTAIHEVLPVSDRIRQAVCAKSGADEIHEIAMQEGMLPFVFDGVRKAAQGITSLREVARVAISIQHRAFTV